MMRANFNFSSMPSWSASSFVAIIIRLVKFEVESVSCQKGNDEIQCDLISDYGVVNLIPAEMEKVVQSTQKG